MINIVTSKMIGCKSYKIIEDKWSSTTITRDNKEIYIKGRNCDIYKKTGFNLLKKRQSYGTICTVSRETLSDESTEKRMLLKNKC